MLLAPAPSESGVGGRFSPPSPCTLGPRGGQLGMGAAVDLGCLYHVPLPLPHPSFSGENVLLGPDLRSKSV